MNKRIFLSLATFLLLSIAFLVFTHITLDKPAFASHTDKNASAGKDWPICHGKPFKLNFRTTRSLEPDESVTCTSEQQNLDCKQCCNDLNNDGKCDANGYLKKTDSCSIQANDKCSIESQDCVCKDFNITCKYTYKDEPPITVNSSKISISPSNDSTYPEIRVSVPPAPTPEPIQECNAGCDKTDASACSGAKDGCTVCTPDATNPDIATCQKPQTSPSPDVSPSVSPEPSVSTSPSVSPSISPTACYVGKFCQNCGGDAGRCTDCDGGWCEGNPNGIGGTCRSCGQTPSNPPEPSKPPFSSDMCKCDGLTAGTVIPGQPLAVTAYGKVVGSDTANAEMTGMQFYFIREIESPNNVIATARVGVTRETNTSNLKRYKAVWNVVVPKDLVSGATYRIFVRQPPYCSRATAMLYTPAQEAVTVSKTTPESSFVTQIIGMMQSILPWKVTPAETGSTLIAQTSERAVLGTAEKPLQIGTFAPATKLPSPDKCYIVRFRAP